MRLLRLVLPLGTAEAAECLYTFMTQFSQEAGIPIDIDVYVFTS